ncbi:MAG: cysteine desulfurase [Armatimonadetes bacterium]|nr:cysteine desulfurase [Armatimonadota bacterium]
MQNLYFDNAASTRVDPRVLDSVLPFFSDNYANPSALHGPAQAAHAAVEEAREAVAELLGAGDPSEIIFTTGATEANNTVLNTFPGQILVSDIEHPSVRTAALASGRAGLIPVDGSGVVDEDAYRAMLANGAGLVSVMLVNNEIGTVQDIDRLGTVAKEAGARFHSDVTQSIGKMRLCLGDRPIDYASLSGHKMHAPKGIGALWVRSGAPLEPFLLGGSHERVRRAGTLNVPGIVGLGMAARLIIDEGEQDAERMRAQHARIVQEVIERIPDCRLNGQPDGAPHIISLSFFRTEGESVIINLDAKGICCTAGAACASGENRFSHVLTGIGLPEEWLRGTVRVSLSKFTTPEEVDTLIAALEASVSSVRSLAEFPAR